MNKNINIHQPVEVTYVPVFQDKPFTVSGDYEAVKPVADRAEKQLDRFNARGGSLAVATHNVGNKALGAIVEPVRASAGRLAIDLKAGMYDRRNSTNFLDIIKQRRQDEKDMAMARKLGLVGTSHCAKHDKQLAHVRAIR